jgi:hypothetical protein
MNSTTGRAFRDVESSSDSQLRLVSTTSMSLVRRGLDLAYRPVRGVVAPGTKCQCGVRMVGNSIRELKTGENPALQLQIGQLKEALAGLDQSVNRLGSARSILTDDAIGQLGRTVADTLRKLRDCSFGICTNGASPHPQAQKRACWASRASPVWSRDIGFLAFSVSGGATASPIVL